MIVTERFIFVHMHKTGGQTINNIISNNFKHSRAIGYHYPYSLLPPQFAHLPLIAFVRNPWDWYVSWYAFNRRPNTQNALFAICSDGGKADFVTTVNNLIKLGDDSKQSKQYRDALISVLPNNLHGNRGVGLTKECIRNFSNNDKGYYSWLFNRMTDRAEETGLHIGLFENLKQDFLNILETLKVPERPEVELAFTRTGRTNSSSHSHYSCYYDSELEKLIGQKEYELIDKFNYCFEHKSPPGIPVNIPDTNSIDPAFRKLLNRENNYLLLKDDYDVSSLTVKLQEVTDGQWVQSGREERYTAHSQSQSLLLIHDEKMRHRDPHYHDLYYQFESELQDLMEFIGAYYGNDGHIIRLIFTRLLPGEQIRPHIDGTFSLLHCHRIHIPIITNNEVTFTVGGENKNMKTGEIWEINNATVHGVSNDGNEARTHLIVDWVPNSSVQALDYLRESKNKQLLHKEKKNGRDDPCPCGSKLKFRHCHGALKK